MRLTENEKNVILDVILHLDTQANIYLYESRVDDSEKGGDIDLFVMSEHLCFEDKIDILMRIKDQIGEQKIDLSIATKSISLSDPFFSNVLKKAILLNK